MVYKSITPEIRELRLIITESDQGVHLSTEHQKKIIDWSKDSAVLSGITVLKNSGSIIEGPNKDELLSVVDQKGNLCFNGDENICFPRWLCHLLGIRHRCSHAVVVTYNNFIIFQRRSREKDVSPGALDISVGGHVKDTCTYEDALLCEMYEELGIKRDDTLKITEICLYENQFSDPEKNFYSIEARKVFEIQLKDSAFNKIKFVDKEVAGIYLCDLAEAKAVLRNETIASGLKGTLPLYMGRKMQCN